MPKQKSITLKEALYFALLICGLYVIWQGLTNLYYLIFDWNFSRDIIVRIIAYIPSGIVTVIYGNKGCEKEQMERYGISSKILREFMKVLMKDDKK